MIEIYHLIKTGVSVATGNIYEIYGSPDDPIPSPVVVEHLTFTNEKTCDLYFQSNIKHDLQAWVKGWPNGEVTTVPSLASRGIYSSIFCLVAQEEGSGVQFHLRYKKKYADGIRTILIEELKRRVSSNGSW